MNRNLRDLESAVVTVKSIDLLHMSFLANDRLTRHIYKNKITLKASPNTYYDANLIICSESYAYTVGLGSLPIDSLNPIQREIYSLETIGNNKNRKTTVYMQDEYLKTLR